LRSALREDPDVVLVGEMRDLETIRLALTAAGDRAFGVRTLHTSSAAKTIDRIVDVFRRRKRIWCGRCFREPSRRDFPNADEAHRRRAYCGARNHDRHPAIRNLIREGKIAQMYSAIQTGQVRACRRWTNACKNWCKKRRKPRRSEIQGAEQDSI